MYLGLHTIGLYRQVVFIFKWSRAGLILIVDFFFWKKISSLLFRCNSVHRDEIFLKKKKKISPLAAIFGFPKYIDLGINLVWPFL